MPDHRLDRTRRAYRDAVGDIRATAGGDWVTGMGASYVPCPNSCGRMVACAVDGRDVAVAPCTRCATLALMAACRSTSDRALRVRMDVESA